MLKPTKTAANFSYDDNSWLKEQSLWCPYFFSDNVLFKSYKEEIEVGKYLITALNVHTYLLLEVNTECASADVKPTFC